MSEVRGTSLTPMILGIIGGVLGLPNAICTSLCTGITAGVYAGNGGGGFFSILSVLFLIAPVVGLVAGIQSRKFPKKAGIVMIICAIPYVFNVITGNLLGLAVLILFLLGGILSINQKTEVIETLS
jgi:hypothetical protein